MLTLYRPELEELRARLRLAVQVAGVGLWDWNVQSGEVVFTPEWKAQLGYEDSELPNRLQEWESRIHSDDRRRVFEHNQELFARAVVKEPRPDFQIEYRLRHRDGSYRWVLSRGAVLVDRQGKPHWMLGAHIDITDRKREEEALRATDELLRQFIEHAPAPLAMVDRQMRYLSVSRRWMADYRLKETNIIGKSHYEVFPEIPARWKAIHRRVLAGEVVREEEDRFERRDGSVQWLRWEVRPWYTPEGDVGGIVLLTEDITDRRMAQLAIQEGMQKFQALFDQSTDAVIVHDLDGHIIDVNMAAAAQTAYTREELLRLRIFELRVDEQPPAQHRRRWRLWQPGQFAVQESEYCRKDGTRYSVEVSIGKVRFGDHEYIQQMIRDITQRKITERALKASLREKETLLQELYHRTKNSMQVIASLLELQALSSGGELARILDESRARVHTMALAHEKLYKGRSLSRINLREYLTDLACLLASSSGVSDERIGMRFDMEEIDALIDTAVPCGLILNELLSNAFKYAFPHGRTGHVDIGLHRRGHRGLELTVGDDGVGVPREFDGTRSASVGMKLVNEIATHQLRGTATLQRHGGVRWIIAFSEELYCERV